MEEGRAGKWCILQTSAGRTLPLARALSAAGYEGWTPRRMESRRRPRSTVTIDRELAIAPGFVFVPSRHLDDLWRALALPVCPFPPFSVFTVGRRVPEISGTDIQGLKAEETKADIEWQAFVDRREKKLKRSQRYLYGRGTVVRVADQDSMLGMVGVVAGGNDRVAQIEFSNGHKWNIETWRLIPDHVDAALSGKDAAARTAMAS